MLHHGELIYSYIKLLLYIGNSELWQRFPLFSCGRVAVQGEQIGRAGRAWYSGPWLLLSRISAAVHYSASALGTPALISPSHTHPPWRGARPLVSNFSGNSAAAAWSHKPFRNHVCINDCLGAFQVPQFQICNITNFPEANKSNIINISFQAEVTPNFPSWSNIKVRTYV